MNRTNLWATFLTLPRNIKAYSEAEASNSSGALAYMSDRGIYDGSFDSE